MPLVSIIIPCYNEQATIRLLLEAIYRQTFPRENLEVIIADGLSTDRTRNEIAAFQEKNPDLVVRIIDNPKKIIPAGLNRGLESANGQYIVRLDAHSIPESHYVQFCIADLEAGLGENVGGVWEIQPGSKGWIAKAIAKAASHPVGVGDALYRYATQASLVDTVPFGAFHRDTFLRLGNFDESLLTNEDYEFNTRLRLQGGKIWLDPQIRSVYFSRPNLAALAHQYWRYGYWKWRMLRRYPSTLRWRQALPPLFTASLIGLGLLSPWMGLARIGLGIEILLYLLVLLIGSFQVTVEQKDFKLLIGVPLAVATMHIFWGAGFLWSLITSIIK
ncbi:MAG: glycosyltransferase family 2 protein [Anaerolineaceae bacterium]|nr:glycosyltransferase family 2 protein [Anaerolineaceae bacterium]